MELSAVWVTNSLAAWIYAPVPELLLPPLISMRSPAYKYPPVWIALPCWSTVLPPMNAWPTELMRILPYSPDQSMVWDNIFPLASKVWFNLPPDTKVPIISMLPWLFMEINAPELSEVKPKAVAPPAAVTIKPSPLSSAPAAPPLIATDLEASNPVSK